jgi:hypothetical protein
MNNLRQNIRWLRPDDDISRDENDTDGAEGAASPADAMENEPEQDGDGHVPPEEEGEAFADENSQSNNTENESGGDVLAASTNDEQQQQQQQQQQQATFWNAEEDAVNEERRREALLGEIQRSQRANFVHFFMLCLVPTSLLLIVVANVVGESTECDNYPVHCSAEPRSFINAFTSRCICDAVIAEQP